MAKVIDKAFAISEKRFAQKAAGYLRKHGWHVQRNGWVGVGNQYMKGFPDMVCVRERVVFVELKTEIGKLRSSQAEWRDWIWQAGGEWELWRPSDWEEVKKRYK